MRTVFAIIDRGINPMYVICRNEKLNERNKHYITEFDENDI